MKSAQINDLADHSASRHYSGAVGVVLPAAFLAVFADVQLNFGLIFYMRDVFAASESAVGWLAATSALSYILGCFVVRFCINRMAPRRMLVLWGGPTALLTLGIVFAPSMAWLFVLNGLRGLVTSFFWPPMMGWLSMNAEGPALNRVLSRFNLSWSTGAIVAPFCAGWLTQWNVHAPLQLACALFGANAALLTWAAARSPQTDAARHVSGESPAKPARDQSTWMRFPAWVAIFAAYFGIGVVTSIFPMAAKDWLCFPGGVIGGLLLMRSLANTGGFILLGRSAAWHFRNGPLAAVLTLGAMAFLTLPHAGNMYLVGAMLGLVGFCGAVCYTYSIFHGTSGSADRGRRMAIHEAVLSSGTVAGAALGGMIYHSYSIAHVYIIAAVLLGLAAVASVLLSAWARTKDGEPAANGVVAETVELVAP